MDALTTTFALKRLRDNNIPGTIQLLEMKLDNIIADLQNYQEIIHDRQDNDMKRSLSIARQYRSQHPQKSES